MNTRVSLPRYLSANVTPPPGRTILCSALCFPPAISHSVYTHDVGNENDAMTFSIEATEGSFLADGRLHLFA
jgi:hypothetical protein